MPQKVSKNPSLDEVFSSRQFTVRSNDQGEFLSKMTFASPKSWDEKERAARFVMTAEIVDRYGDIVVTKGGDLKNFNENPVALFAHNSRGFPIGQWGDIKTVTGNPRRMEGTMKIADEGALEEADTAAKLIAAGILRACSIGFMPKAWESLKDDQDWWTGWKFVEWELMECSACAVPANPAAIVKAAGGNTGLALQSIELVLDEWALNPDGLIVPRKDYEKAFNVVRRKDAPTMVEVRAIEENDDDDLTADTPVVMGAEQIEGMMSRIGKQFAETIGLMFGKSLPEPGEAATTKEDLDNEDRENPEPELKGIETLQGDDLAKHVADHMSAGTQPFIMVEGKLYVNPLPETPELEIDKEFESKTKEQLAKDLDLADEADQIAAQQEAAKLMADIED